MPNRPTRQGRPQANSGGGGNGNNKGNDLSGLIAGLVGGGLAGGLAAEAGPTAADAGADFSGVGPEEGYNAGMAEVTPKLDPKSGNFTSTNFTPYSASTLQNILTRGQAGLHATSLNNAVYLQQLANQNALDVQGLRNSGVTDATKLAGENAINLAVAQGKETRLTQSDAATQAADKAKLEAKIAFAKTHDISLEAVDKFAAALDPKQQQIAGLNADNSIGLLKLLANAQNPAINPQAQANVTAGFNATQFAPAAKNMALTGSPLGIGQASFPMASFGSGQMLVGQGLGSDVSQMTQGFDKNTGQMIHTTTNTHVPGTMARSLTLNPDGKPVLQFVDESSVNNGVNPVGQFAQGLMQPANNAMQFVNTLPPSSQQPQGIQQTQPTVNPKGEVDMQDYYTNPIGALFRRVFPHNVFNGQY